MPGTATYNPTGDAYLDGVLMGTKWAVNSFTFSFPTDSSYYGAGYGSGEPSNGFAAFNPAQEAAVRATLQLYAAIANVTFSEIAETSTQHADLRYAESNAPGTAWAYYPTTSSEGGDAWFNNAGHYYDNPADGNYAWLTIIHETGHTLGLKHPQDVMGAFGAMPLDHDSLEYSVMSYRSYIGASTTTGYTNGAWSYPQTTMMYDIAGVQQLYGANYNTNASDTVYKWDPSTGQEFINGVAQAAPGGNKIFMTVWDGGGHDTYDFSNYTTDLKVDLQPGHWSTVSAGQLADLDAAYAPGTHMAAGNIANALLYQANTASLIENAVGGAGNDTIVGNNANNKLTGGPGNDSIDGVAGNNTAVYSGLSTEYRELQNTDGSWNVTDLRAGSPDGSDTLKNIQNLQFADKLVAIGSPTPVVNSPPIAQNDAYSVNMNSTVSVTTSSGVLANDSDPGGNKLSAVLVSSASHGTVTLNSTGALTYAPSANYYGSDSFTYKANDGALDSNTATVSITVNQTTPTASHGNKGTKGKGPDVAGGGGDAPPPPPAHDDNMRKDQAPAPAQVNSVASDAHALQTQAHTADLSSTLLLKAAASLHLAQAHEDAGLTAMDLGSVLYGDDAGLIGVHPHETPFLFG